MKLIHVKAVCLKGLSFELSLSEITYLVGENFAGKSARTEAIILVLLGFLPSLGKRNEDTFGLCSGREMIVEGKFDDGSFVRRRWFLKGDSIRGEKDVPEKIALYGPLVQMLDADSYFELSERDQIQHVADNVPGVGASLDIEGVSVELLARLRGAPDIDQKSVGRIVEKLADRRTAKTREPEFEAFTTQSLVAFLIESADEEKKIAKDQAARMEKTVQGVAQLRLRDDPPADVPALEERRKQINAEIARLQGVAANNRSRFESNKNAASNRAKLTRELSGKVAAEIQLGDAEKNLAAAREELAGLPKATQADVDEQAAAERGSSMALSSSESDLRTVNSSIERNEAELAAMGAKTSCPYCGATGDGWKALKQGEISSALAGLKTKRIQIEEHASTLRTSRDGASARASAIRKTLGAADELGKEIARIEKSIAEIRPQLAYFKAKEEELAKTPPEDPTITTEAAMVSSAMNVQNDALAAVDADIRAAAGRSGELKRLAEAETERDAARLDEATAKEAAAILRETQAKIVAEAFAPLLVLANSIFGSVLKTPLAYDASRGEIGTWRNGGWVGHKTFTGVEKLVGYAAIQAALAASSPVKMMILDEMLRAHKKTFAKIDLAARAAVKSGAIEQFVGILPCDRADVPNLATEDGTCQVLEIS